MPLAPGPQPGYSPYPPQQQGYNPTGYPPQQQGYGQPPPQYGRGLHSSTLRLIISAFRGIRWVVH
jgi:hypothetical protein